MLGTCRIYFLHLSSQCLTWTYGDGHGCIHGYTVKSISGSIGNISGRHLCPQVLYPYIFALEVQHNTSHGYLQSILPTWYPEFRLSILKLRLPLLSRRPRWSGEIGLHWGHVLVGCAAGLWIFFSDV